jgi:hypothetical protein
MVRTAIRACQGEKPRSGRSAGRAYAPASTGARSRRLPGSTNDKSIYPRRTARPFNGRPRHKDAPPAHREKLATRDRRNTRDTRDIIEASMIDMERPDVTGGGIERVAYVRPLVAAAQANEPIARADCKK